MKIKSILASVAAVGATLLLSSCSMLGGLLGDGNAQERPTGDVTQSQQVDAFSLEVGDCLVAFNLDEEFSDLPLVPCTEPHDSEVVSIFDMPDGTFDDAAITDAANDQCPKDLATYVGPNYENLGVQATFFVPTEESWEKGDREIDCVAVTNDGESSLTSSLAGAGN